MKLWGGRFQSGPSPAFERFSGSLSFDSRLLEVDIRGSQAFARALQRAGILTAAESEAIVAALEEVRKESPEGATDEDVHTFVIRKLKERTALADKIHTGRSRNEQVSLDTRLWLRGEIDRISALLDAMTGALLDIAERYPDAIIPGYTHLRRAQPVLWPHYCLAYFEMFARDRERLVEARKRVNVMPLGSGAIAGSGFALDRDAIAVDLDFAETTRNSMDVSGDRDFSLDFLHFANLLMLHLSRLAEDWIIYSSDEFGWLDLGDGVTSGSSLMPQKKNPDALELIRGKAGRVFGSYASLLTTMKGLPMTYNRDMQEDKVPLFDAVDQVAGCLTIGREAIETAELRPEAPLRAAEEGWTVATDLAEELARRGMPFHQAHQLTGRLVLESVRTGKKPGDWTAADLAAFAPEFDADFARLLDPSSGLKTREIRGGTGPTTVRAALKEARARWKAWNT